MTHSGRLRLLACLTLVFWAVIFLQKPNAQNPDYHNFADQRTVIGIPHCLNVVSNLAFLVVGLVGLQAVVRISQTPSQTSFVRPADSFAYQILFGAVILVAVGSAYYHLRPTNSTLLWDRLPMSIAFMAFLTTVITERVDRRSGIVALFPLVMFGLFSVLYWHFTERASAGDLRYYIVAQGYPVLFGPIMTWLLPSPYTRGKDLYLVALLYIGAKATEVYDAELFTGGWLSGHTCKHLLGALGTYWLLRMVRLRTLVSCCPKSSQ